MEKNKGLTVKRRKDIGHSRIKRRKQYDKALIKRRSQVPSVKRELNKYGGESRGIKTSVVKSVKFKT
uniref:Sas10 C-terminal domain-containing protein n=1 Tax=Plectus sambesii TaxID=2011161 RepID=A0A914XH29_9BILA